MIAKVLKKVYHYGTLSPDKRDHFQKLIRDTEWKAVQPFIPPDSYLIDIGCGAGYNLVLAHEMGCRTAGIDPDPYGHGVGRRRDEWDGANPLGIRQATADKIPFEDDTFDVVFCSHVLEHIEDRHQALEEMKRVLKPGGTLILGMPTATMASINFISQLLFNTHKRFIHILGSLFKGSSRYRLIHLLVPRSHSFREKTIFYDLKTYRITNWEKIVSVHFSIRKKILPALYPYPDFVQFFKLRKIKNFSSSIFFICQK
jgi:ubiquinone/menaquinone biosynthesis C-methylase UbiE